MGEDFKFTDLRKIAIVGGRDFDDFELLCSTVNNYLEETVEIVSGGAKGADSLAEKFAKLKDFPITVYKPDWEKYGRAAGMIRNGLIIKDADIVFAFWDGTSKGTENSIKRAEKLNKELIIIKY